MRDKDLVDRDSGILSKNQRRFLAGEVDLESEYENPQKQANLFRYRIRNKVEQALFDFILLKRHLHEEDWRKIYEEYENTSKDYRAEANHTGEVPDIEDNEPSEILLATEATLQFVLNALASVAGRETALAMVEQSIKQNIQQQNILHSGQFYYGNVETNIADFEDNSVVLDAAYECLEEATDETAENKPDSEDAEMLLYESLIEFTNKLPEMPPNDFVRLIDALRDTGRMSEEDYEALRPIAWAIAFDVKRPQIAEAIDAE